MCFFLAGLLSLKFKHIMCLNFKLSKPAKKNVKAN